MLLNILCTSLACRIVVVPWHIFDCVRIVLLSVCLHFEDVRAFTKKLGQAIVLIIFNQPLLAYYLDMRLRGLALYKENKSQRLMIMVAWFHRPPSFLVCLVSKLSFAANFFSWLILSGIFVIFLLCINRLFQQGKLYTGKLCRHDSLYTGVCVCLEMSSFLTHNS